KKVLKNHYKISFMPVYGFYTGLTITFSLTLSDLVGDKSQVACPPAGRAGHKSCPRSHVAGPVTAFANAVTCDLRPNLRLVTFDL
ncbi:hypothetical protein KKC44_06040, partial [Patescibacteria group bacterium]|nr:hypothetical protein [Patescibacteria group bacterium]